MSEETRDLFARANTELSAVGKVSDHIRTGRRWDVTHKDIVGQLIVIHDVKDITTKYGDSCLCRIDHEGMEKMALLGGIVLMDQVHELAPHMPVMAVIRKPARAYVLTDPTPEMVNNYRDEYLS